MPSITDTWRDFLIGQLLTDYPDAWNMTVSDLEHRYYTKLNGLTYPPLLSIGDLKYASFTAGIDDPADGLAVLSAAEGFFDARNYSGSGPWLNSSQTPNLSLQIGSTASADSNDPTWLPYNGTPYVFVPDGSGNTVYSELIPFSGAVDIRMRVSRPAWDNGFLCYIVSASGTCFAWDLYQGAIYSGVSDYSINPAAPTGSLPVNTPIWLKFHFEPNSYASQSWSIDGLNWTELVRANHSVANMYPPNGCLIGASNSWTGSFTAPIYYFDMSSGGKQQTVDFSQMSQTAPTISRATGNGLKTVLVNRPCWLFGTDDLMTSNNQGIFDIGANQPFTLILARRKWGVYSNYHILASKRDFGTSNPGYDLVGQNANFNVYGEAFTGASSLSGTVAVPDGKLSVIGLSRDATGLLTTLVDGKVYPAQTQNGSLSNVAPFTIASPPNYSVPADMEVFGLAWFRRGLTSQEVQQVSAYFGGS